ncbi:MAG: chemotaxis protein CheD [Chrysiogenales bacterium]|nr:MAG: chemotaxis protein CheD [Chrysiogenales bacterium]
MEFDFINVGIAEFGVSEAPNILRTILGSCVGICLYDPKSKVGGMSHIMLPSLKDSSKSMKKYADTAIPMMLEDMERQGAARGRVNAKIVGGAKMFSMSENSVMGEIGNNNIAKVKEVLKGLSIALIAEDTGGNYGRTIDFYLDTGKVKIKSMGREERVI